MNKLPPFTRGDRVLVLAPHPDDEALATGGLLQRAADAGAQARVVFLTDGDNNPWPQRVVERRWQVSGSAARERWGAVRRKEARASLLLLGQGTGETDFWGLPDQGLTGLLLAAEANFVDRLHETLSAWQPTHLVSPSVEDRHPDHGAVGLAVDVVLRRLKRTGLPVPLLLSYIVHGNPCPASATVRRLVLDASEVETKRYAILCHLSQVLLSRRRFVTHARMEEFFLLGRSAGAGEMEKGARIGYQHGANRLGLKLNVFERLMPASGFCVLVESVGGKVRGMQLPVSSCRGGTLRLPAALFDEPVRRVFVKIKSCLGLYQSTRWRCLPTGSHNEAHGATLHSCVYHLPRSAKPLAATPSRSPIPAFP